ncbi:MAG: hypothetical protein KTR30_20455 [Saprospiraceae bacterium]|nr:hypothetical protein [Saprospiraceae bacterium]
MRTLSLLIVFSFFSATYASDGVIGDWLITTPDENGDPMDWQLTLSEDGSYQVDIMVDGSIDVNGKYWIEGKQITFQNAEECGCCDHKGVYKFWVENDKLWVDPIDDKCELRKPPHKVYFTKA